MSDAGLLGPGSPALRVDREGALLLGGGRALLLRAVRPPVRAAAAIAFAPAAEAKAAVTRLGRVHARAEGATEDGTPHGHDSLRDVEYLEELGPAGGPGGARLDTG